MIKSISVLLVSIIIIGCEIEKPRLSLNVERKEKRAKNIILMIADGWGYNHIAAANHYTKGELKSQVYESFPVQFPVCTSPALSGKFKSKEGLSWRNGYNSGLTYSDSVWRNIAPTGSGAAATAIASGRKTYNASIGMDIYFKPLKSIAEKAKELGKSAGLVTSVPFTHATPASFASHNVHRSNYDEIAREMIKGNMDLIFGCGHPNYNDDGKEVEIPNYKYVGGKEFWSKYISGKNFGRKLITKQSEFEKLLLNPIEDRLLGLPQVHSTLQAGRSGDVNAEPNKVPFTNDIPSLKLLSNTALSLLNQNPKGFFLMVEGGAVDWASHSNQYGRMIEELNSFNETVKSVVKWIETNSSWDETLLIVTADHETGYLTGINGFNSNIESNGKGELPKMMWNSHHHTNVLIPLFAKGVGSELFDDYADEIDSLQGYFIQNSEIGQVMFRTIVR